MSLQTDFICSVEHKCEFWRISCSYYGCQASKYPKYFKSSPCISSFLKLHDCVSKRQKLKLFLLIIFPFGAAATKSLNLWIELENQINEWIIQIDKLTIHYIYSFSRWFCPKRLTNAEIHESDIASSLMHSYEHFKKN